MNITGEISPRVGQPTTGVSLVVDGGYGGAFYRGGTQTGVGYPSATGGSIAGMGIYSGYVFDASRSWSGETSYVGSSQAVSLLSPYLAVYMWKRVS